MVLAITNAFLIQHRQYPDVGQPEVEAWSSLGEPELIVLPKDFDSLGRDLETVTDV